MDEFLKSVSERDFDRRISEVVEMLEEKQLYGTISLIKDLKYYLDLATKEKAHTCNCQHNSNSRDNEPCCGCDNRTAKINKARVNSLEIIAHMLNNKPYYELKYRQVGKNDYSIGYSSYDLKIVLGYIDTYFEIVESDKQTHADRIRNMSDEELASVLFSGCIDSMDLEECPYASESELDNNKIRKICKKCTLDWLQSEAE